MKKALIWLKFWPVVLRSLVHLPAAHVRYLASKLKYENPQLHAGRVHINSFFPPYPSAAFERFLASVFRYERVPHSVYYAVTDRCPYTCGHCSYGGHRAGRPDTAQALAVIEQIQAAGASTIGLTGGEPLMREDIAELVRAAARRCAVVMFSTGYGLDAERAAALRDAGLTCLTIGLESDRAEEHDRIRGTQGSFETGVEAARQARAAGLFTAISTVATREKLRTGTLERMAGLGLRLGAREFRILNPVPTGAMRGQENERLSVDELRQVAKLHQSWNRGASGMNIAAFAHLESSGMFGCGAGFHHAFIDAAGNVCPCDLTPLALGNVYEKPLADIWHEMAEWFDLPRQGCFSAQVCAEYADAAELPIGETQSRAICARTPRRNGLPGVYANLFRKRPPRDRQTSRE